MLPEMIGWMKGDYFFAISFRSFLGFFTRHVLGKIIVVKWGGIP